MKAYVQTYSERPDGTRDSFCTVECTMMSKPLWWQEKGLSYTASGYGNKIPTTKMVRFNGRWHRVYCRIFSNVGTVYIQSGKLRFVVNCDY